MRKLLRFTRARVLLDESAPATTLAIYLLGVSSFNVRTPLRIEGSKGESGARLACLPASSLILLPAGLLRGGAVLLSERRGESRGVEGASRQQVAAFARPLDALRAQHVQLQRTQEVRTALLETAQVVENGALEGAFLPVSGAHHPSFHPLDGEYTRCLLTSYETCSCSCPSLAVASCAFSFFFFFFSLAPPTLHRRNLKKNASLQGIAGNNH